MENETDEKWNERENKPTNKIEFETKEKNETKVNLKRKRIWNEWKMDLKRFWNERELETKKNLKRMKNGTY